ncbi:MAG: C39 family peptidase [Chloroflexota bacterium]|nr:C39 family peptidase [Chloroflexota bacterium]
MSVALARTCAYRSIAVLLFLLCAPLAVGAASAAQSGTTAGGSGEIITGFPVVGQAWALSCEYAATSAATAYYGNPISQRTFLNAIGYDENPHKGFRGSIYGAWGGTTNYGVYAEPIAAVLRQEGYRHSSVFYGGASALQAAIAAGHPVVTWISGTWGPSSRVTAIDAAGDWYSLIAYEHAVTAYGYDDSGVWVMDPGVAEKYHISWAKFERGWNAIDGMALVVAP